MSFLSGFLKAGALIAGLAIFCRPANAQTDAAISVHVRDSQTRAPIQDANVVLDGHHRARTDARGQAAFAGLAFGTHTMAVRRLGYSPRMRTIVVTRESGSALQELELSPVAVRLPSVLVQKSAAWSPLGSFQGDKATLAAGGGDAVRMLRLARAMSGSTFAEQRMSVDGLASAALPPGESIQTIAINADPFSVLQEESDMDVAEISLQVSPREFRWGLGVLPWIGGARNPLAANASARKKSRDAFLSIPLPLRFVLTLQGSNARQSEERPTFTAADDGQPRRATAHAKSAMQTLAGSLSAAWSERGRIRVTLNDATGRNSDAESGGFVQWGSATSNAHAARDLRVTGDIALGAFNLASGVGYSRSRSSFSAAAEGPTITVLETMVAGSPAYPKMRMANSDWRWVGAVRDSASRSLVGWKLARKMDAEILQPNPHGELFFGQPAEYNRWQTGQGGGMRTTATGSSNDLLRSTSAALFAERTWNPIGAVNVRTGLRADNLDGSWRASPRVSLQALRGNISAYGSAGIFRQPVMNALLLQAQRFREAGGSVRFVEFPNPERVRTGAIPVYGEVDTDFQSPGALGIAHGVELVKANSSYGIEHKWTQGFARAGSRRIVAESYWRDQLESNRTLKRHQLHARFKHASPYGMLAAHYEWTHSKDNSEGPFAFPERRDAVRGEWARSAGVAPHNLSLVFSLPELARTNAAFVYTARSVPPMDIRTGSDVNGSGLYNDRGGRRRNSARGPDFQSLDAYVHKRVRIPFVGRKQHVPGLDVSLLAENLLGHRNYTALAASTASPWFGKAIGAMPGRSVQVSLRLTP